MKKKPILFLLIFITTTVSGQGFWIQPDRFIYKRIEPVNVKFLAGENFTGDNWTGDKNKINCLELYFDNAIDKDLFTDFGSDEGDSLQLAMIDEGTVMLTLNTKNSLDSNEAEKFNDSPENDGLTAAPEYRVNGDTIQNSFEKYQLSVKTIFQVGDIFTHAYKKNTDLPLDIVPTDNPYSITDGNFKAQIFFMGQKLKNSKVKIWHKLDEKVSEQDYTTNEEGEIKFPLSAEGEWMISCVKRMKLENDAQAEWQSYRGSLTWGYY